MADSPSPLARAFPAVGLAFLIVAALYLGARVLIPVVEALVVWFVVNALANGLRRLPVGDRLPRGPALVLAAAIIFAAGALVVRSTLGTIATMGPNAAGLRDALDPLAGRVADALGIDRTEILNRTVGSLGLEAVLRQVIAATVSTISHFGIVAIYVAFLLVDQQFFEAKLRRLAPEPERRARIRALLEDIGGSIQSYLRVMTLMSALTTALCYAVMRLVGLEYAGFWATAIFFLNFIPSIGSILGTVLPTAFALVQFQQLGPVLATLGGIGLVQFLVGNVLLPRVAGGAMNISLFVTIFSLFAWGAIWGVTGMFVAMPMTAILIIGFSRFEPTRPIAILLSRTGEPAPPAPRGKGRET